MPPVSLMGRNISILYRYIQVSMAKRLEAQGIGMGQYAYIIAVCEQPGVRQDMLTDRLFYNKSSVARGVASLIEAGFLRRETDRVDKRCYHLFPTEKGLEAREMIRDQIWDILMQLTADFDSEERDQAAKLLNRMAQNVYTLRADLGR